MTFRKSFDCYEFYDRAKVGEKCTLDDWDLMKIPMKAMELKQKYGLDFNTDFRQPFMFHQKIHNFLSKPDEQYCFLKNISL